MQTRFVRTCGKRFLAAVAIAALMAVALPCAPWAKAEAADSRAGRFSLGGAMGAQGGTADGTAFALGLYGDYYLTRDFSIGPLLQIGVTSDLYQIGFTAQAKYTLDIPNMPSLKPNVQAGFGIIHAELDRTGLSKERDNSFLAPFGVGAAYKLMDPLWLEANVLVNFTNLSLPDHERFFTTWLIGLNYLF